MAKRLAQGRREELLDGFMNIVAERGFADLRMSEVAGLLHCSAASLYKITPSKESLVLLVISRWGDRVLQDAEAEGAQESNPRDRARAYYQHVARAVAELSPQCRIDIERYDSTRLAWSRLSEGFIDRFSELLGEAVEAGEARAVTTRFIAQLLRQMTNITRNQQALQEVGLTADQALLAIDDVMWNGLAPCA